MKKILTHAEVYSKLYNSYKKANEVSGKFNSDYQIKFDSAGRKANMSAVRNTRLVWLKQFEN